MSKNKNKNNPSYANDQLGENKNNFTQEEYENRKDNKKKEAQNPKR